MGGERAGRGTPPLWVRIAAVAPLTFALEVVSDPRRSEAYRFIVGPAMLMLAFLFAIISDRLWSRRRSRAVDRQQAGPWAPPDDVGRSERVVGR